MNERDSRLTSVSQMMGLVFMLFLASCSTPMEFKAKVESKKGVGFWNANAKYNRFSPQVDALGCSWYYNWTLTPNPAPERIRAEFVPMVWNGGQATPENLAKLKKEGSQTLLTFNEPDVKEQANMKVAEALEIWPRLMETGMRLGSPAPAAMPSEKNWLTRFMKEADERNYRVDFICLHWYGDITAPDAADELKNFLEYYWKRYHRPIWLTEFSGSSGSWLKLKNPPMTNEKNAAFIKKALPMLNSLPYVERYAWFELKWEGAPWSEVALVDPRSGELTLAGQAYQNE